MRTFKTILEEEIRTSFGKEPKLEKNTCLPYSLVERAVKTFVLETLENIGKENST
jgi:hypothetical protein